MLDLTGKVALVMGCGAVAAGWGNGRATAVLLARQGAQVFGTDLHEPAARATLELIQAEGFEAAVMGCDATQSEQVAAAVAACIARFGRIDILVNNVGVSQPGGPVDMDEAVWDAQIEVNLKGAFLACKHVIPHMRQQGGGGHRQRLFRGRPALHRQATGGLCRSQGGADAVHPHQRGDPRGRRHPPELRGAGADAHAADRRPGGQVRQG